MALLSVLLSLLALPWFVLRGSVNSGVYIHLEGLYWWWASATGEHLLPSSPFHFLICLLMSVVPLSIVASEHAYTCTHAVAYICAYRYTGVTRYLLVSNEIYLRLAAPTWDNLHVSVGVSIHRNTYACMDQEILGETR